MLREPQQASRHSKKRSRKVVKSARSAKRAAKRDSAGGGGGPLRRAPHLSSSLRRLVRRLLRKKPQRGETLLPASPAVLLRWRKAGHTTHYQLLFCGAPPVPPFSSLACYNPLKEETTALSRNFATPLFKKQQQPTRPLRSLAALRPRPRFQRSSVVNVPSPLFASLALHELSLDNVGSPVYREAVALHLCNFGGEDESAEEDIIEFWKRGVYRVFVLCKNDLPGGKTVAGVVMLAKFDVGGQRYINLEYLAINKECRSGGLGSLLVQALVSQLKRECEQNPFGQNPLLMTLECKSTLFNFYATRAEAVPSGLPPKVYAVVQENVMSEDKFFFLVAPVSAPTNKFSPEKLRLVRDGYLNTIYNMLHGFKEQRAQRA